MPMRRSVQLSRATIAFAAVLFGTSGVAVELLAPDLPAVTSAGWRVVLGGAVLVAISAARGVPPWQYPSQWRTTMTGAFAFVAFQLGFFTSVGLSGVATATIITIGTGPIVAGLIDRIRRGTPLIRRWWTGVGVALAGIALITGAGGMNLNPAGCVSAIIAGCCFPLFGSAIRGLTNDRPPITAAATVFGVAIIPAAALLTVGGGSPTTTPGTIAALLYLGVITTGIAYAFWSTGLARLTLSDTVTLTMLELVVAAVLAVAILGEVANTTTVLGITSTLVGVWVASTTSRPADPAAHSEPATGAAHRTDHQPPVRRHSPTHQRPH